MEWEINRGKLSPGQSRAQGLAMRTKLIPRVILFINQWKLFLEERQEICLSSMTKAPSPTEKSKKQHDNKKKRHQNFDNPTILDRLRTGSLSNNSHPTGVV